MHKFISLIAATFLFTINSFADDYEDEVRKRLGLLKDIPVVSMPGMAADEPEGPVGRSGETVYNQGCAACHPAG